MDVAREAARNGATISIDPNVRPSLIADMDAYRVRLEGALDLANIVKTVGRGRVFISNPIFRSKGSRRSYFRSRQAPVPPGDVTLGAEAFSGVQRDGERAWPDLSGGAGRRHQQCPGAGRYPDGRSDAGAWINTQMALAPDESEPGSMVMSCCTDAVVRRGGGGDQPQPLDWRQPARHCERSRRLLARR